MAEHPDSIDWVIVGDRAAAERVNNASAKAMGYPRISRDARGNITGRTLRWRDVRRLRTGEYAVAADAPVLAALGGEQVTVRDVDLGDRTEDVEVDLRARRKLTRAELPEDEDAEVVSAGR